ncbi:MAG: hypothetical protein WD208_11820 [Dehalococcoidia bacterium]
MKFNWMDDWAEVPGAESAGNGWAHHGVVVNAADEVIVFHPRDPRMMVFDPSGSFKRSWDTDLTDAHGMTLVQDDGTEYIWAADNGRKRTPETGYDYEADSRGGQFVKMDLAGNVAMRLCAPDLPVYRDGGFFSPTGITVFEERHGGNGDVWASDGYGQSQVHRFSKGGDYLGSITGQEGRAGAFNCPHAVWVDVRKPEPELYIADRGNARLQVYDLEGTFKRSFGTDFLTSPSAFARYGDLLIIAELRARLTILDINDNLVGCLGANEAVCDQPGWPNMLDENGNPSRTNRLAPGRFNSPHGVGADSSGNIYVSEWLIGGRYTRLAKA